MIALIADDLTGASDAGVQFARRGLATRVLFDLDDPAAARDAEALAVDTDSRALPAAAAYARVRQVAEHLRTARPEHVYKKIDSTLRGNLGAEIDAVMDALEFRLAVVAPAFPALGRTTRQGVHYLRGTPVSQTEIGRDPKAPVRESNLVCLLEDASRRAAALVPLATIAEGPESIRRQVEQQAGRGASLLVCDAEDDADLRVIVDSLAERRDVLWVGSAGLAEHLTEPLGLPARAPRPAELGRPAGPVLLVAGSVSETTRQQVAAVEARPGVAAVELDPLALVGDASDCRAEVERCRQALRAALADGRDCALTVGARREQVEGAAQRGAQRGLRPGEVAARIADALGTLAADCARPSPLGGLILTGGDTARAVCRHLGVTGVQLLAEVEPGVPLGRLLGQRSPGLLAVTKAGAFGSEHTLVHALDQLKGDR
jgi:uncharacterized protein YgbK (DUF1537 family)